MHAEQSSLYHRIWLKLHEMARLADQRLPAKATPEAKLKSHEKFIAAVEALELQKTEREYGISFKFWLIESYHHEPSELIKHLFFLQWIRHPFHHAVQFEPHLIEHVCQTPKAIEILHLVFATLHPYNFQMKVSRPPYALPTINDELFYFLIDNHEKYSQPKSPIFWALKINDINLLTRILTYKPEMLNIQNHLGETPLMTAIRMENELGVLKLIEYQASHKILNHKNQSIAHIACKTENTEWLIKLIKDPRFAYLQISHMIADQSLIDIDGEIPLSIAIYKGYISLAQSTLEFLPHLRAPLLNCYFRAIENNSIDYLNVFFHELHLDFSDMPHFQMTMILYAMKQKSVESLNWLLDLPFINLEIRKSALFLRQIENNQFSTLSAKFAELTIDWQKVPNDLCYKITTSLLIKNQSQFIAEFNLFDLSPYFHSYFHPKTHEKTSFLHFIYSQTNLKLHKQFTSYVVEHLAKHPSIYPNWLYEFHDDFFKNLALLGIDLNILVHGQPLLHFYENNSYQKSPDKYLENMTQFINPSVDINAKNQHVQHLFAKLISDKNHGFERIITLKNAFHEFSLENLDDRGSNLLHLAIENNHLTSIRWCLNQNIDPYSQRRTDGLSAIQLILNSSNLKMFDILRKHIKKSKFLSFIEELVTQKKDEFIAYLFSHERPFSWIFTEFHIEQLLSIPHEIIQARFYKAPNAFVPEVEKPTLEIAAPVNLKTIPKLFRLDHEILLNFIETKNIKQFEQLIREEYQEILNGIFSENFFDILEKVFHSDCKNLNKIFIRIPQAQEYISRTNAWHELFTKALRTSDLILIENMLGRQSIHEHLRINIIEYYQIAMHSNPGLCHEILFKHFPLNKIELKSVFIHAVQAPHDALLIFLRDKPLRLMFDQADAEVWYQVSHKDIRTIKSCLEFTNIERHFLEHASNVYIQAIRNDNPIVLANILSLPKIRRILKQLSPEHLQELFALEFGEKVLPIWAKYEEELETVLNYALQIPNKSLLNFIKDIKHRLLLTQGDKRFWYEFSQKDITILQDCFEYSTLEHKFLQYAPEVFIQALREHNEYLQNNLLSFPQVRQKLKENGQRYLQHLLDLGFRQEVLSLWSGHHELASLTRPYHPVNQVILPDFLRAAFQNGFQIDSIIYLVGSTIHYLLNKTPFDTLNDIDFIGTKAPKREMDHSQFFYIQSRVKPQLYFYSMLLKPDKTLNIEYFHHNQHEGPNFIAENYLLRDFTVNSLYCDNQGRIFDPSNMGIKDLENRLIRSIQDPLQSFLHDPIRILRAIRLMIKGFELTPEVRTAIADWSAQEATINYGHLFAMTNSMLSTPNDNKVFQILVKLNLTERLLNYTGYLKLREFKAFVHCEAHRYKYPHLSAPTK